MKTGKDKKYRTDTSCLVYWYYLALTGLNLFSGGPKPLWFWCYSPSGPSVSQRSHPAQPDEDVSEWNHWIPVHRETCRGTEVFFFCVMEETASGLVLYRSRVSSRVQGPVYGGCLRGGGEYNTKGICCMRTSVQEVVMYKW